MNWGHGRDGMFSMVLPSTYPTVATWLSVGDRWPIHVGDWGRLMKGLFIGVSSGLRKPKLW